MLLLTCVDRPLEGGGRVKGGVLSLAESNRDRILWMGLARLSEVEHS